MIYDRIARHYVMQNGEDSGIGGDFGGSSGDFGSTEGFGDGGDSGDSGDGGDGFNGSNIFGGDDVLGGNALLSSEDILKRGRELALLGVPLQVSNLFEALAQLRARATGSTAEIFPAIIGQLSELRSQYAGASQAISRRLGFAGGGQVKREQGKALAGAARQYGGLLASEQQASFANLINTLSGLQPALSGAARSPSVSVNTQERPVDFSAQGARIASMIRAARQIQNFYNNRTPEGGIQPYPNLPAASEATLFGATPSYPNLPAASEATLFGATP